MMSRLACSGLHVQQWLNESGSPLCAVGDLCGTCVANLYAPFC